MTRGTLRARLSNRNGSVEVSRIHFRALRLSTSSSRSACSQSSLSRPCGRPACSQNWCARKRIRPRSAAFPVGHDCRELTSLTPKGMVFIESLCIGECSELDHNSQTRQMAEVAEAGMQRTCPMFPSNLAPSGKRHNWWPPGLVRIMLGNSCATTRELG